MKTGIFALAASAVMGLAISGASAGVIYATSFEAPTFTAGANISGQDGWTVTAGNGQLTVETGAVARTGQQYARYVTSGANATGKLAWKPFSSAGLPTATDPIIVSTVWIGMNSTAATNITTAGLEVWNNAASQALIGELAFNSDGTLVVRDSAGDVTVATPPTVTLDQYHKVQVAVDFNTTQVNYYLDNALVATSTSPTAIGFGDADLIGTRTTTGTGGNAIAWDDYSITSLPEPALASVLIPAALLIRRRTAR